MKACKYCGRPFEPTRITHVYCSVECRKAEQRRRYDSEKRREYYLKNREHSREYGREYTKLHPEYYREYRRRHRERIRARNREFYRLNRESIRARNREYYRRNRERLLFKAKKNHWKKWRREDIMRTCEHCGAPFEPVNRVHKYCSAKCRKAADRKRHPDYYRKYYLLYHERHLEYARKYHLSNRERIRARKRKYYLKNRERILLKNKEYRWEHWK